MVFKSFIFSLLLVLALPLKAQWIEATGSSVIGHQDLVSARRAAIRDALRQASFQGVLRVNGYQAMNEGQLHTDQLSIETQSSISEMQVLSEVVDRGILSVNIRARVIDTGQCKGGNYANAYRRSLAIGQFYLENPHSANMGALHDASERLPKEILQRLQHEDNLRVFDATNYQLYQNAASLPSSFTDRGTLTTAMDAATRVGAQYVLSGVIRNLDLINPELAGERPLLRGFYERTRYKEERFARNFSVDLFIHDGFTGDLVTSRNYTAGGYWTENRTERVGFASTRFWEIDYGQRVDHLIEQMVSDLRVHVGCQPFMARITRVDNLNIYLDVGSNAGLNPGDTLGVFRRNTFFDNAQRAYTELIPVDLTLSLERVQPDFSRGKVEALPEMYNIQQGDVIIAW